MHRQKGLSFSGFAVFIVIVGFFAFLGLRLAPAYMQYYSIVKCMKELAADPAASGKNIKEVRKMLEKRLDVSYVESIKPDEIRFDDTSGTRSLTVSYEVRKPLIYNLDFVAKFEKSVPMQGNQASDD